MYKAATVPGDGALHVEKGGALESESSHDVSRLAPRVGPSAFDVSKAPDVRGRVTPDVCKPGSDRRELAQGVGSKVETVRESPPGLCLRGDVRSEPAQDVYEPAQAVYSVVRGRPRGRRGHEEASTGHLRESRDEEEARRGPRPAGERSAGREQSASARS